MSALILATLAVLATSQDGRSQQVEGPRPHITIAPTIIARAASRALVTIGVGPPEAVPNKCLVSLRGLPARVSLPGWEANLGSWTIPLLAVRSRDSVVLEADIPAGVSGHSEVVVSLIGSDGSLLAEATTVLQIAAAEEAQTALPQIPAVDKPAPEAPTLPTTASVSSEVKARAEKLVARGEKYLVDGNIEAARQFFRRAADAGLAAAALRLAATYDPAELASLHAEGVLPDSAEAKKWYERARELGATDAESRLARLRGN